MTEQGADREQLLAQMVERARTDQAFRQKLIANPRQTLTESTGTNIPDTVQIEVLEETSTQFYLVLPAAPPSIGFELSSEELAGVAGGQTNTGLCTCVTNGCVRPCI